MYRNFALNTAEPHPRVAVFPLAPMDGIMRTMTIVLFPLPVVVYVVGLVTVKATIGAALLMGALWVFIWAWFRPSYFKLSPRGLELVWPVRHSLVPLSELAGAEVLTASAFKERFGMGLRVGSGGLWGGFGLMVSEKGVFRLYVSRMEPIVFVRVNQGRSLVLTPDDPERFATMLNQMVSQPEYSGP